MADVIYSTLNAITGQDASAWGQYLAMARLWAAHLRGPGEFRGRLVLLTNTPDAPLECEGIELVHVPGVITDRTAALLQKVRAYRHLHVAPGDRVLQMDLDALAMQPIEPLLGCLNRGRLTAAPSRLPVLHEHHVKALLPRRLRVAHRLTGWGIRKGVSSCVTGCLGDDWRPLMRCWAAAARLLSATRPVPLLGDQSYLNYVYLTGRVRLHRFPSGLIHHVRSPAESCDTPQALRAVVAHFPLPQRLTQMRRWARLPLASEAAIGAGP